MSEPVPSTDPARLIPPRPEFPRQNLPFLSLLRALRQNALLMWPEAAYETEWSASFFLGRARILLNAPEAIQHVLIGNAGNYRRPAASGRILRPVTGDGLLLSEGDAWRHQRRTLAPAFAPRTVPILARHIAAAAAETRERLVAAAGQKVDLLVEMRALALAIAGRSMFSLETERFGATMRTLMDEFAQHVGRPYLLDMLLPGSIPSPRDFLRRRFQRRWMALIEQIMDARLAAPRSDAPRDLLDLMLAARDPETGAAFSRAQLRDQVATMIVAGHEATAVTLFWCLYLLALCPAEQERLAAETRGLDLSPATAPEALAALPRTRAVVSEALRLYPPAFTVAREAIAPDNAAGVPIPRGAMVMVAPWVLHRHRRLWQDPDVFDPTRFLPDAPPPHRFAYLPFGIGPRVCIGAQFALTEAILVLAGMAQRFRVTLADATPVLPVSVVLTVPSHPALFRLLPRPVLAGTARLAPAA